MEIETDGEQANPDWHGKQTEVDIWTVYMSFRQMLRAIFNVCLCVMTVIGHLLLQFCVNLCFRLPYASLWLTFLLVTGTLYYNLLKSYGIKGHLLLWIKNFLSDQNHCTRIGNVESTILPLLSRVIQGSGIGPILFVMYINELTETLCKAAVTVRRFAGDPKMYTRMCNNVVVTVIQNAWDLLVEVADRWELQISIRKYSQPSHDHDGQYDWLVVKITWSLCQHKVDTSNVPSIRCIRSAFHTLNN